MEVFVLLLTSKIRCTLFCCSFLNSSLARRGVCDCCSWEVCFGFDCDTFLGDFSLVGGGGTHSELMICSLIFERISSLSEIDKFIRGPFPMFSSFLL